MIPKYTIYDAYLYNYKQFIIIVSYTPCINISNLINDLVTTFNFKQINAIYDINNIDEYNYDDLNNKVEKYLEENRFNIDNSFKGYYGVGILIYGHSFPSNKLKFKVDLYIHISASLNMFLKYNDKHTKDLYNKYSLLLQTNKINKYYNIKNEIDMDFNDKIFNKIIDFISSRVYKKSKNLSNDKHETKSIDKKSFIQSTESESMSESLEYNDNIHSEQNVEGLNNHNKSYKKLNKLYKYLYNLDNINSKQAYKLYKYII